MCRGHRPHPVATRAVSGTWRDFLCTNQPLRILDFLINQHLWLQGPVARVCFNTLFLPLKTLLVQDPQWAAPRLLQLPDNYNIIFQYYHRKACTACKKVPKDPALCLVCGAFVCLKGVCCKQQGICECVLVSSPRNRHFEFASRLPTRRSLSDAFISCSLSALPTLWGSDRHLSADKRLCHHHHPWTSFLLVGFCLPRCPRRGGPRFTV